MANNMYCPKCGKALIELANGKRYCKQCQTQYVVSSKTINSTSTQAKPQAKAKEKSSAPLVVLLLLLILLLGGVGGFALYHYFFGSSYGDGKNEAIFCETTGYASYTILYEYEGGIYGKNLGSQKSGLQTNGLFWDGSGEEGGVARCEINGNQCEMIMETWRRYEYNTLTDTGTFQYEIRDQAATEEEYNNYLNQIGWAEDVSAYAEFYDYTPENIRAILLA